MSLKYTADDTLKTKPKWGETEEEKAQRELDQMVPAEVVSRRQRKVSKEEVAKVKDEFITLSYDDVFPKKPKERLKWLYKALIACKEGRVKPNPLFDIISHRKFIDGLKGSIATDTLNLIRGHLSLFSNKQQKQLTSDNFELFRKYAPINVLDSDDDEAEAPPLPPPPEVIIDTKETKKKKKGGAVTRQDEDEEGFSDEDVETKRRRLLAKGVERRVDPKDGQAYTLAEFIQEYGGSNDKPPTEWENSRHTSFIFKT